MFLCHHLLSQKSSLNFSKLQSKSSSTNSTPWERVATSDWTSACCRFSTENTSVYSIQCGRSGKLVFGSCPSENNDIFRNCTSFGFKTFAKYIFQSTHFTRSGVHGTRRFSHPVLGGNNLSKALSEIQSADIQILNYEITSVSYSLSLFFVNYIFH